MPQALISVSDKTNLIPLARQLSTAGFKLIATGGTYQLLEHNRIKATPVEAVTGFPEIMDGRVKTLHPHIHAGILARAKQDQQTLQQHNIQPIEWVIVNLYPFAKTILNPDHTFQEAIENIDIGGPSMIRAAAKNHQRVVILVDPEDYQRVVASYQKNQTISAQLRLELAQKAFAHCALYDQQIANWLQQKSTPKSEQQPALPAQLALHFNKQQDLRYGENPHQQAALYRLKQPELDSLANATLVQGKPLSYNNLMDADACLETLKELAYANDSHYCVIVKHASACGAAMAPNPLEAYQRAFSTDPSSAFGGILAFNSPLDDTTISQVLDNQFLEILIAPEFSPQALHCLRQKPTIRVLQYHPSKAQTHSYAIRQINSAILYQQTDSIALNSEQPNGWRVVSNRQVTNQQWQDVEFAWRLVKRIKSNAIVLAREGQALGLGAGQTSRVFAAQIAILKAHQAGFKLGQSILASDAFLPFADVVELAAQQAVSVIVQPGGSVNDAKVIASANSQGITMIMTGKRHFLH